MPRILVGAKAEERERCRAKKGRLFRIELARRGSSVSGSFFPSSR